MLPRVRNRSGTPPDCRNEPHVHERECPDPSRETRREGLSPLRWAAHARSPAAALHNIGKHERPLVLPPVLSVRDFCLRWACFTAVARGRRLCRPTTSWADIADIPRVCSYYELPGFCFQKASTHQSFGLHRSRRLLPNKQTTGTPTTRQPVAPSTKGSRPANGPVERKPVSLPCPFRPVAGG